MLHGGLMRKYLLFLLFSLPIFSSMSDARTSPSEVPWGDIYAEKARIYLSNKKTFREFVENNNFSARLKSDLQNFIRTKNIENKKIPKFLQDGSQFHILEPDFKITFDFTNIRKKQVLVNGKVLSLKVKKNTEQIYEELNSILKENNSSAIFLPLIEAAFAASSEDNAAAAATTLSAIISSFLNSLNGNTLAIDLKSKMEKEFPPYEFQCTNGFLTHLGIVTIPKDMAGHFQFRFTYEASTKKPTSIKTIERRINGDELTCTYRLVGMAQIKTIQADNGARSACNGEIGNPFYQTIFPLLPYEELKKCCEQEGCVHDMKNLTEAINQKIEAIHGNSQIPSSTPVDTKKP